MEPVPRTSYFTTGETTALYITLLSHYTTLHYAIFHCITLWYIALPYFYFGLGCKIFFCDQEIILPSHASEHVYTYVYQKII